MKTVYVVVGEWCEEQWPIAAYESEVDAWHHAALAGTEGAALDERVRACEFGNFVNPHDPEWFLGGTSYGVKAIPFIGCT